MLGYHQNDALVVVVNTAIGAVVGALYTQIVYFSQPNTDGSIWLGIAIGMTIGFFASVFEIVFVSRPGSWIRQLPFLLSMLVRAAVHVLLIYYAVKAWQGIYQNVYGSEIVIIADDPRDTMMDVGFSISVVLIIVFYMQMRLFIGGRTLRNLIIGRYHQPHVEERIFMIVDVVGTTKLAQEIGDVAFHKYLNRIFILLDDPLHRFGGEVHSYVGDAIFAIWPVSDDPKKNSRPLKALADMHATLERNADKIEKKFGVRPEFRTAIHRGPVVAGESGHRKRQITFLGNTVNLASRMESLTKSGIGTYLASRSYLDNCMIPEFIKVEELGEFEIKGSERKIALSRLGVGA